MSEEATDTNTKPDTNKNGKPRKKRSSGRLAFAFVGDATLSDGTPAQAYLVPPDQPEYAARKDVKEHIEELVENDSYQEEFATLKVATVRLVTEPQALKVERTTKVTFD